MAQLVKNPPAIQEMWVIPWVGISPLEGHGNPLQYPYLENYMDRGAWQPTDDGVTKNQAGLSD